MKALVIYELVPEETKAYFLDVEGGELKTLRKAHGAYVNTMRLPRRPNEFLEDKPEAKIEPGKPFDVADVELVVHSGFVL
jgi:hypothetical protein